MANWTIQVDVRMRKTLMLSGPEDPEEVRKVIEGSLKPDGLDLDIFQAYRVDEFGKRTPVERIIDNHPEIISITQNNPD